MHLKDISDRPWLPIMFYVGNPNLDLRIPEPTNFQSCKPGIMHSLKSVSFWAYRTWKQWNLTHGVDIISVAMDGCIKYDYCTRITTVSTNDLATGKLKYGQLSLLRLPIQTSLLTTGTCPFCSWPALHKDTCMSQWRNVGHFVHSVHIIPQPQTRC